MTTAWGGTQGMYCSWGQFFRSHCTKMYPGHVPQLWHPMYLASSLITTVLDWSEKWLKLNPSEHLWSIVKRNMKGNTTNNEDKFKAAINATWIPEYLSSATWH
ncbi:hypothetical protein XENORESO_019746 [Xenotaenia resolanae]|uniref:Uncharacterized protein n=1 Tax=Xenotaenia resolanae TaxID=208358 RepID=A0ABV0VZM4_9TELE